MHKSSPLLPADARERGYVQLQCLGRSLAPLEALLGDVQTYHLERSMSTTTVFRALTQMREIIRWVKVVSRPSREIGTVILEKEKKHALLNDINEYLHPRTRRWYANHGIPYRRGYLFSGAPGTGKTSLTSALAGVFGLDIYVLSLLDPAMNESQLMRVMSEVPSRCIVLLEDVDAAGLGKRSDTSGSHVRKKRQQASQAAPNTVSDLISSATGVPETNPSAPASAISLSGLLNAIDGVASHEGRILIMTTNAPNALDKALVRPGRVDMHIHFELPSRPEIEELFLSMFSDESEDYQSTVCSRESISSSKSKTNGNVNGNTVASEDSKARVKDVPVLELFTTDKMQEMAQDFAKALPEGEMSLAEIQGFMLRHKGNPLEACRTAHEWATERTREMEAQEDD